MLRITTGRAGDLPGALMDATRRALSRGSVHVVVPKQLTLQTELELIRALAPNGSFDINVTSPERLCARIFSSAGKPALTRVDDRGRVMLARAAIREAEGDLRVYSGARHRRGFPARAARQLEIFRQAGLSSDDVFSLADAQSGLLEAKTRDMARILRAYEGLIAGRFQDGEAEFLAAAERCAASDIAKSARFVFYGFDIIPAPLHALIGALAAGAEVEALFAFDALGGDARIFECVGSSLSRLERAAKIAGARTERRVLPPSQIFNDIDFIERNLHAAELEPRAARNSQICSDNESFEQNLHASEIGPRAALNSQNYSDNDGFERNLHASEIEPRAARNSQICSDNESFGRNLHAAEIGPRAARNSQICSYNDGFERNLHAAEIGPRAASNSQICSDNESFERNLRADEIEMRDAVNSQKPIVRSLRSVDVKNDDRNVSRRASDESRLFDTENAEAGLARGAVSDDAEAGLARGAATDDAEAGLARGAAIDDAEAGLARGAAIDDAEAGLARGAATDDAEAAGISGVVRVAALEDVNAEAAYVAGRARELAKRGLRWRDMAILCGDMDNYAQPLADAFADFEIPLFMTSSRASSRHALSEALLSALRLISRGFRTEDALALLRSGFSGISGRDSNLLANYFTRYQPRGRQLTRAFSMGDDAAEMDLLRVKLLSPVLSLREDLRAARELRGRLRALFAYLSNINAYETVLSRSGELAARGMHSLAGEETQVWNRLISTLDQAAALMGESQISLSELEELLRDSLDAALVKPLPQSGDAVCAQSADGFLARRARCVFFIGQVDRARLGTDALLSARQLARLAADSGVYLGPDESDSAAMRIYYVKCALGLASDAAIFTYPMALSDGSAQKPSALVNDVKCLLNISEETATSDPDIARLLVSAPRAAFKRGVRVSGVMDAELARLTRALDPARAAEAMLPETAREIYGALDKASVTRLEAFARCPFSHFIKYALVPERIAPFSLSERDEGSFFHEAVRAFVSENMARLGALAPEDAARYMDGVSETLLSDMETGALGTSNVALAQKRRLKSAARAAARALVSQMRGSEFQTVEVEMGFGGQDARALKLTVNGQDCALEGRVDRVDSWENDEADYLRVIDYKRGGTELRLGAAYLGLQLQLIVYLAAAMRRRRALGAGVYYFRVDEGIVSTQETDEVEIERRRAENMRLRGLSLSDEDVLRAMAPAPDDVITIKINKDGTISKTSTATDVLGMRRLIDIALERAGGFVGDIRAGTAAPAPARTAKLDACKFCENRRACLFDENADRERVRKLEELSNAEVLELLRSDS